MNKLVLVRHGSYNSTDGSLIFLGVQQMEELVRQLITRVDQASAIIVSSTATRAKESAAILAAGLNVSCDYDEVLWSESSRRPRHAAVLDLVKTYGAVFDTVILVTHLEYMEEFPPYFGQQVLDRRIPFQSVDKGEMRIIDCADSLSEDVQEPKADEDDAPLPLRMHQAPPVVPQGPVKKADAVLYAQMLRGFVNRRQLLHVYLFGSTAVGESGNDADIVLELPKPQFLSFAKRCVGIFDGFHPIEKVLLGMASVYWDYHSPMQARFGYALDALGLTEDQRYALRCVLEDKHVDLLCMPCGWDKPGAVHALLQEHYGLSQDPKLLDKIIQQRLEILGR